MAGFFKRGGYWVLGQLGILAFIISSGIVWHNQWHNPVLTIDGILLLCAGVALAISGFAALGKNLTPYPKPAETTRLVQHGVYRFIRHPLYTALIGASLGWSCVRQSWPALIAALAMAVFLDAKARVEERSLRQQFPDYASYERRVRRFIPWIY